MQKKHTHITNEKNMKGLVGGPLLVGGLGPLKSGPDRDPICFPSTPKTFLFRQSFPDFVLRLYYASVDFVIVLLF